MYLAMTNHAVSTVLLRLDQCVQKPIFYISKTLVDSKTHYLPLEKVVLAIIHAAQKLPHYFQALIVHFNRTSLTSIAQKIQLHKNDS